VPHVCGMFPWQQLEVRLPLNLASHLVVALHLRLQLAWLDEKGRRSIQRGLCDGRLGESSQVDRTPHPALLRPASARPTPLPLPPSLAALSQTSEKFRGSRPREADRMRKVWSIVA
jgi:hypothetical protein